MSKKFYFAIVILILAYWLKLKLEAPTFPYFENGHPILKIQNGQIRGHSLETERGKEYYAFQEIPYASPPIGDLRLKDPVPPDNWDGILETIDNTKVCYMKKPPMDDQTPDPRENEDCLYLNVFTPKLPTDGDSTPLPILFYIYGGMFQSGEPTEYNFDWFLEQDVIVVTATFRSGALGFLTTRDGVIPSNLAFKDQILVLKWIQKNIEFFGGDPSKVTLAGHSSGGSFVGLHVHSRKSTGLFRGAILQSASHINHHAVAIDARYIAFALGSALSPDFNFKNSSEDLLKLLKTLPAEKIMRTDFDLPSHLYTNYEFAFPSLWGISIEDYKNKEAAFLTGAFHDDLRDGNINRVPILIGITEEENMALKLTLEMAASIDENITAIITNHIKIKDENRLAFATALKEIYTKVPFQQNMTAFYKLLSDVTFANAPMRHADLQSKYADTYFYQFTYKGHLNGLLKPIKRPPGIENKPGHCEELPFLYKYRWDPDVSPSSSDILTQARLTTLWGNFIKYSNPTPKQDPLLLNVIWPKVTPNEMNYLEIGYDLSIKKDPRSYKLWKQRLDKYFEHPMATY